MPDLPDWFWSELAFYYGEHWDRMTRFAGCSPSFARPDLLSLRELLRKLEEVSRP